MRLHPHKLGAYLQLLRPFTLLAPVVGGFLFGWLALTDRKLPIEANLPLLLLSCLILAMANATSNILNQVFDRDLDAVNPEKRTRPIPSGGASLDGAISIGVLLLISTIFLGLVLFGVFYGALLSIILAFSWMYNSPPLRLKMRLGWGNFAISAPRGGLGIMTAYSAFSDPLNLKIILATLYFGVYVFGTNTLKDFADYESDLKSGVRNFVTVYGKKTTSKVVSVFLLLPFLILALAGLWVPIAPTAFTPIILSFIMMGVLWRSPEVKTKSLENNILWLMFYLQFLFMMVTYVL